MVNVTVNKNQYDESEVTKVIENIRTCWGDGLAGSSYVQDLYWCAGNKELNFLQDRNSDSRKGLDKHHLLEKNGHISKIVADVILTAGVPSKLDFNLDLDEVLKADTTPSRPQP